MKRLVQFSIIGMLFFGFSVAPVSAETTVKISNNGEGATSNVNVHTNTGNNTICVNGKCTTTSNDGQSKSTVCINGKCSTSDTGNVDVQSEDGKAKVKIDNNANFSNSVNSTTDSASNAAIEEKKKEIKEKVETKKKEIENKKFELMKFIQEELESLKKLFTFDFLFGK